MGESTDGEGFLRSLREEGHDPGGASALVLGAGGAARAVVLALAQAGAAVRVAARRADAAADAAALAPGIEAVAWDAVGEAARSSDLIVNATPIGMAAVRRPVGSRTRCRSRPVISGPARSSPTSSTTRGARRCSSWRPSRGAATVEGVGMLVHQGAIAFERWTAGRRRSP